MAASRLIAALELDLAVGDVERFRLGVVDVQRREPFVIGSVRVVTSSEPRLSRGLIISQRRIVEFSPACNIHDDPSCRSGKA